MARLKNGWMALLLGVILAACSPPHESIIGTWQDTAVDRTLTFHHDGRLNIIAEGTRIGGNYRFIDDAHLELEFQGLLGGLVDLAEAFSGPGAMVFEVEVSRRDLRLTDARGKTTAYTRVK